MSGTSIETGEERPFLDHSLYPAKSGRVVILGVSQGRHCNPCSRNLLLEGLSILSAKDSAQKPDGRAEALDLEEPPMACGVMSALSESGSGEVVTTDLDTEADGSECMAGESLLSTGA